MPMADIGVSFCENHRHKYFLKDVTISSSNKYNVDKLCLKTVACKISGAGMYPLSFECFTALKGTHLYIFI